MLGLAQKASIHHGEPDAGVDASGGVVAETLLDAGQSRIFSQDSLRTGDKARKEGSGDVCTKGDALGERKEELLEPILKAYRMPDRGATTPSGKVLTDEQGEPIRLSGGEAAAQAMGFRPEKMAQISGEHWTMENVKKHYLKERRTFKVTCSPLAGCPVDWGVGHHV